ncbi:DUF1214 domain-containing protein [Bradyrhizobium japonicum]|uniref:DUF1214 domain-containing protein n=1 Tax=Bradyrhizobium japonicum TaxID=375 RepID=UPI002B2403A0|nr:DUF1214 domain-containing protein [Bradyrhizobium japonicum]WRK51217.1 DUF1214 domain-containing protein [Bradyrhizobium japonicum]
MNERSRIRPLFHCEPGISPLAPLSCPGLTGASSTPQPLPIKPASLEYWVARSRLRQGYAVYDAETRSEIATDQGHAALRSMFELKDAKGPNVELSFGPSAPAGQEKQRIKTIPGKGWFVYFRIYGQEAAAFNGSWKLSDFEQAK